MAKGKAREKQGSSRRIPITCAGAASIPIEQLEDFQGALKTLSKAEYQKLRASIERHGFSFPVSVWKNGRKRKIIDGHQRLAVVRKMVSEGWSVGAIPVDLIEAKNEKEAKTKVLAAASQYGRYDEDSVYEFISKAGLDFSHLKLEIDLPQLDMDRLETGWFSDAKEGLTDPDDLPEVRKTEIKPGQMFQLGDHRILCGDSTDQSQVQKLLNGVKPPLMVTDPPYGVDYDADWRNRADRANGKPYGGRAIGLVQNDHNVDWRKAWELFQGDIVYCWHAGRHASTVQAGLEASGFQIRCQIIWAKPRFVISRGDYHWQHEPCWYAVRKGASGHWNGDRSQTTLWPIAHPKSETGHSTQKPIDCMRRPIENNSRKGHAIYDPFVGSGTTIIAAHQLDRSCFAMEIDPAYVQVAIDRWENFSGQKAKRLA